jgi:hypothetical protein
VNPTAPRGIPAANAADTIFATASLNFSCSNWPDTPSSVERSNDAAIAERNKGERRVALETVRISVQYTFAIRSDMTEFSYDVDTVPKRDGHFWTPLCSSCHRNQFSGKEHRMTFIKKNGLRALMISTCLMSLTCVVPASAAGLEGVYRGFLAFDFKGKEVRERLMVTFGTNGMVVFGAEEGQDEPLDPKTGIVTKNDFESTTMGLWRPAGQDTLEFGVQQFRAGSGLCGAVKPSAKGVLPSCSFVLTARLKASATVRGTECDLGGVGGGFGVQSVDGVKVETNPLGLGLKMDYCLQKQTVDSFLKLAPIK